jgi:hypothetical protein
MAGGGSGGPGKGCFVKKGITAGCSVHNEMPRLSNVGSKG